MQSPAPIVCAALLFAASLLADGAADNRPGQVRRIPPAGVAIALVDRQELDDRSQQLGRDIASLRSSLATNSILRTLLPDIEIFHKAVRYALDHDEFFHATNDVSAARQLIREGLERAQQLRNGTVPWTTATGLVVRGYTSKIDGSVQPFGLVIPATYSPNSGRQYRLDAWFHGRDETLSELRFLAARQKSAGEFTPPNTIVLHLYGRYCNANKFAGEIDFLEALDRVHQAYPIDDDRIVVRGFSMGGAACWQFATHYAGRWAAAAPGAGFAETADFLKVFQNELVQPPWYEQKLWHWYDSTDYAVNLFNCPTIAYSGEVDKQKQAADMMEKALAAEGLSLAQIIGLKAGHQYTPAAKEEINRRVDSIVALGRQAVPKQVRFTTWTLRYNEMSWVTVDGLARHWERARVDAQIKDEHTLTAATENVTALTLTMAAGRCPLDNTRKPHVVLDGAELEGPAVLSDRSWIAHFEKRESGWKVVPSPGSTLRKRHGLQGPIDDAFMDSFLMVHPTGQPLNDAVGAWAKEEEAHAIEHWRRQFRGDARVKNDTDITEADIRDHNLVLWGDPGSNRLLGQVAARLPLRWDAQGVHSRDAIYPADRSVAVLIYPNPLNPERYIVVNSGFTYREYDYLNNARQVPKLPDYAVIDVTEPPSSRAPGRVATAGFFDEEWQLPNP